MNKYIDAEKLKTKVNEVRQDWLSDSTGLEVGEAGAELGAAESILDSFDGFIDSLQQEQPEVDLEKEMDMFYGMYRDKTGQTYDIEDDEPCFDWKEDELSEHEMRIAHHFYELGLKARKED